MRISVIGDIKRMPSRNREQRIENYAVKNNIDIVVLAGGIDKRYDKTLKTLRDLRERLEKYGKQLRFITSNCEYYSKNGSASKEEEFREKEKSFNDIEDISCIRLELNPITVSSNNQIVRIIGNSFWYDYSLYKGRMISARRVMRKRKLWYVNQDNRYITNSSDYLMGIDNSFDRKLTARRICDTEKDIQSDRRKYGENISLILISYYKPVDYFCDAGVISGYKAAFEGSGKIFEMCRRYGVNKIIFGMGSKRSDADIDGVRMRSAGYKKSLEESAVILEVRE